MALHYTIGCACCSVGQEQSGRKLQSVHRQPGHLALELMVTDLLVAVNMNINRSSAQASAIQLARSVRLWMQDSRFS